MKISPWITANKSTVFAFILGAVTFMSVTIIHQFSVKQQKYREELNFSILDKITVCPGGVYFPNMKWQEPACIDWNGQITELTKFHVTFIEAKTGKTIRISNPFFITYGEKME